MKKKNKTKQNKTKTTIVIIIIIIIIIIINELKQVELFLSLLSYATNSHVCPFHAVASESGCI